MIAVVDYGVGNLGSVLNMLKKIGRPGVAADTCETLAKANAIILPGVGAFDAAMDKLHASGLIETLKQKISIEKVPVLGICLGMQLLFGSSQEGTAKGLEILEGSAIKFVSESSSLKIPHMGWNHVIPAGKHPLMAGLEDQARFYFVHSYHIECPESTIIGYTDYGGNFPSLIGKENILGAQFHPEKSHKYGMKLLHNFTEMANHAT